MADGGGRSLRVEDLSVELASRPILSGIRFHVPAAQTLAVIGASGCGKTTLLKAIGGLLPLRSGRVTLGDTPIESLPAQARGAVYLYQEPLLFPHMDVFGNIAFGLRMRGRRGIDLERPVQSILEQIGMAGLGSRRPPQLSGGQRQRVAFGRALIIEPSLLLLDEPFSNLDPDARAQMQALFRAVAHARGITSVFVTHDIKEALLVGDRYARFEGGSLICYPDRDAFCADPASGVGREAAFWRQATLNRGSP